MAEQFKLGDTVQWCSQAQGCSKTKRGTVVEIVYKGNCPDRERFPKLYKGSGCGSARGHESYVIEVMTGAKLTIPKHYWPVVSCLNKIGAIAAQAK